jgi:hypothetical protein
MARRGYPPEFRRPTPTRPTEELAARGARAPGVALPGYHTCEPLGALGLVRFCFGRAPNQVPFE